MYTEQDMLNAFLSGFFSSSWKWNGSECDISRENRDYLKETFEKKMELGYIHDLDYYFPEEEMEEE